MKTILLTIICLHLFSLLPAQSIILNGEKIQCDQIIMKTSVAGPVLIYKVDGKENKLSGEECWQAPTVNTISATYDLVPTNPEKPNGKGIYMERVQEGPLRLNAYAYLDQSQYTQETPMVNTTYITVSEKYKYFVQLPDGKYYEIDKSNFEKFIEPVMLKCAAGIQEMENNNTRKAFSVSDVILDIVIYNKICGELKTK